MVSAIIPAFNEERTIKGIIRLLEQHPLVGEIIVVNDGSTDRTCAEAEQTSARVISLQQNSGKAVAMSCGVDAAQHEFIFFLDADIIGLTLEGISALIEPVASGEYEMFVAIRGRKMLLLNKILHFFPILGGERVLTKQLWYSVPDSYKHGFQIEIALNYYAKRTEKKMGFKLFPNLTQVIKERKYGFLSGFARRVLMSADVVLASINIYLIETPAMFLQRINRDIVKIFHSASKKE